MKQFVNIIEDNLSLYRSFKSKICGTNRAPWFKDSITKELNEIYVEMQNLFMHKQAPSARLVQKLGQIVKRDSRLQKASAFNATGSKDGIVDVCPEVYQGGRLGYPFYAKNGWYTTNCTNAKPIRSVISILVNTVAYPKEDENHVENVLKGITETYPTVQVHLATNSKEVIVTAKKYKNVHVIKMYDTKQSRGWNSLRRMVSTPYVLVTRDICHFTWLTQLERQIRVVSQIPNVAVAGGAYRNLSGHWKSGCVQTKLKNYVLEYQEGYYHSKNECMFCDYLQGPFVTKTSLFKLDESLPDEVIFDDWFLRVVQDGALIMACPDAMYFTIDYYSKRTDKKVWTPLAKKWELNRVLLSQGVRHSFSCQDNGLECSNFAQSSLLPVCCLEMYADALSFLQRFSSAHNIEFELDSGSAFGGVKFNGLIPWDIDGDVFLLFEDIPTFSKPETIKYFKQNGYCLGEITDKYLRITFNGFDIELWGMSVLSNTAYLSVELRKYETSTKANIRGNWIETNFSPGLYARNRYGREILKHSQSWRKVGLAHSFEPCKNPIHHACLNSFPGDGDIPFLVT